MSSASATLPAPDGSFGKVLPAGPARIFISFIHEEQAVAEAIQRLIQEVLDVRVFISSDQWAVFAGEQWLERIKEAMTNARIIVLMLSPESVKRPWVHFQAVVSIKLCKPALTSSLLSKS